MSDLILPNGGEEKKEPPYDFSRDMAEFTTKVVRAIGEHQKLHAATIYGVLSMIANDVHHNMLAQVQQTQMAQAALQKLNADRLRSKLN